MKALVSTHLYRALPASENHTVRRAKYALCVARYPHVFRPPSTQDGEATRTTQLSNVIANRLHMGDPSENGTQPRVLMIDDEMEVADAYVLRLRDVCDVKTAYNGPTALDLIEERDIDIVLLDRHMPEMSGDEVLSVLDERGYYGKVIMVTAIDPGFDVLEMPFDDYLCKPMEREDVRAAVDQQATILGYETLGEYFSVESKREVLSSELQPDELAEHAEYRSMSQQADRLEDRLHRLLKNTDDLFESFGDIRRESR